MKTNGRQSFKYIFIISPSCTVTCKKNKPQVERKKMKEKSKCHTSLVSALYDFFKIIIQPQSLHKLHSVALPCFTSASVQYKYTSEIGFESFYLWCSYHLEKIFPEMELQPLSIKQQLMRLYNLCCKRCDMQYIGQVW